MYIANAIGTLNADIAGLESAYAKEPDMDVRQSIRSEIEAKAQRLSELQNIAAHREAVRQGTPNPADANAETEDGMAGGAADAPAAAIPADGDGRPQYHLAPLEASLADIYSQGLTQDEIDGFINANIAESEKELEKLSRKAPRIGTDIQAYRRAKSDYENAIAAARNRIDYWNQMKLSAEAIKSQSSAVISESGLDAEVVDVEIHGSRNRGDAKENSDLDIVVEYHGKSREDDMFNALNDETNPLEIEGVRIDINPIRPEETGDMASYMSRSREYDEGKMHSDNRFKRTDAEVTDAALSSDNFTDEEKEIISKALADGTYMKAPNGADSKLSVKQWAQVRTKAFKEWFGDWEKAARIEKLRKSAPVEMTGEEYIGKYELNRDSAKKWIKDNLRGEYKNMDTGELIEIRKDGAQKVTSHSMGNEAHLKSLAAIPQMIENAIFIDELPNEKGNGKYDSYRYYVCGLKIGGADYTAKITVGVKGASKFGNVDKNSW